MTGLDFLYVEKLGYREPSGGRLGTWAFSRDLVNFFHYVHCSTHTIPPYTSGVGLRIFSMSKTLDHRESSGGRLGTWSFLDGEKFIFHYVNCIIHTIPPYNPGVGHEM